MGSDCAVKGVKRINKIQAEIDSKCIDFMKHTSSKLNKWIYFCFKNSCREKETGELEKVVEEGVKERKRNALKIMGKF